MNRKTKTYLSLGFILIAIHLGQAQQKEVHWLTFEQLEDSLTVASKKVLIDFYADWCAYCKKMEKVSFTDPKVVSKLQKDYYVVKMNAETTDTIAFGGGTYTNKELGKKRNPTHEIALLLASRKGYPFSLPAVIVFNEKFEVTARYFEYLSPKKLLEALEN